MSIPTAPRTLRPCLFLSSALALSAAATLAGAGTDPAGSEAGEAKLELPFTLSSEPLEDPEWASTFREALTTGRMWVDLRYRFEYVDQDLSAAIPARTKTNAYASTLRTVLGYETRPYKGVVGSIEFENVTTILNDLYNSTQNGRTQYPVVPDPYGTSINQVFFNYIGIEETYFKLGRQEVVLDNHRFVGNVGWRQKHQTLEGLMMRSKQLGSFDLFGGYATKRNSVTRRDQSMDSWFLNGAYDFTDVGRLTLYGYHLDFDVQKALNTFSMGARFNGQHKFSDQFSLLYEAEFANQTDVAGNPNPTNLNYYMLNVGVKVEGVDIRLAAEVLEGDGTVAFQTPLATLHKFNGWADLFLITPPDGLEDYFLYAGAPYKDWKFQGFIHLFEPNAGGPRYGTELDLAAIWNVIVNGSIGFWLGNYWADQFAVDTQRGWVAFSYSF